MIFGDKMCSGTLHRPINGMVDHFSFSALNLLRTYNRLVTPTELSQCYNLALLKDTRHERPIPALGTLLSTTEQIRPPTFRCGDPNEISSSHIYGNQSPNRTVSSTCPSTSPEETDLNNFSHENTNSYCSPGGNPNINFMRRQRGEKRPIPDEQKDDKYFERRKRNNEAAKKSRDARKIREDRVAFRAAMLEQENSILRAQNIALRDEVSTLRQLLCVRANSQISLNV